MGKGKEKEKAKEPVVVKLTGETESLVFTGSIRAKYMSADGMCRTVYPGDDPIDTPVEFVKQRLAEKLWKRAPKASKEPKEKKEEVK